MKITKKREKLIFDLFWYDYWFIKLLLKLLEEKWLNDIINTYQFNIWYNQWLKDSMMHLDKFFEDAWMKWDISNEIAEEIWAIQKKT